MTQPMMVIDDRNQRPLLEKSGALMIPASAR